MPTSRRCVPNRTLARYPAVHTGLTTGFCGCLTTFSGYNTAAAAIFARGMAARGCLALLVGFALPGTALRSGISCGGVALRRLRLQDGARRPFCSTYGLGIGAIASVTLFLAAAVVMALALADGGDRSELARCGRAEEPGLPPMEMH